MLNAPFDPHATLVIPEPRPAEPPPPKLSAPVEVPPTIASPRQEQKAGEVVPTITAPAPLFKSPKIKTSLARPARRSHQRLWAIGGILVVIIGAIVFFIMTNTAAKHAKAATKLENESKSASKFIEAETEWRQAVKLEPNNFEWHLKLGFNLAEQQKYAEAEAEYREVIRLKPTDNYFHQLLGEDLEKENKYAEAEAEYREALRLNPDDFSSQVDLDRLLSNEGKEKSKP